MIWLTVDKKGNEEIHSSLPIRIEEDEEIGFWLVSGYKQPYIKVPKGTIEKLIGSLRPSPKRNLATYNFTK